MLCNMGDVLSSELDSCLPIFLDRLKNEITRLTAVKALTLIAGYVFKYASFRSFASLQYVHHLKGIMWTCACTCARVCTRVSACLCKISANG